MGLDASVMCNCFREGRTSTPPFPREWFEIDKQGYFGLKAEYDSDENWAAQYQWSQSCCKHKGMYLAWQRISNWAGYRLFQRALQEIGSQYFPVLTAQLPNSNGGLTASVESAKALVELDFFKRFGEISSKTVLVDTSSGEVLHHHIAAYDGEFLKCGHRKIRVGVSRSEFFAVSSETGKSLFRATRLRQFNRSGASVAGDGDELVWENLDTAETYNSGVAICGKLIPWDDGSWENADGQCRFDYPSEMHVEQRPQLSSDFDDIVQSLRTVFAASVSSGNFVRWC